MSWQAYVDDQMMAKRLEKAAIAGFDGNIWAKVIFNLFLSHRQQLTLLIQVCGGLAIFILFLVLYSTLIHLPSLEIPLAGLH
jgi:hypothetical protein